MLHVLNLRLFLAKPWVHLRWLAMTCAHFGRDQIFPQVDSMQVFHRFSTWPKSVQGEWCPLTYYQPMKYRKCLPWSVFLRLLSTCKETCESVWPGLNSINYMYLTDCIHCFWCWLLECKWCWYMQIQLVCSGIWCFVILSAVSLTVFWKFKMISPQHMNNKGKN